MSLRLLIVVLAGLGAGWYAALPPRGPSPASRSSEAAVVRGVLHVHTSRSDGTGTVDEVAAAAARAGLDFVVFTDHGDATREPDPPAYRHGVLCIDGVEITTRDGHLVALGLPAAPYPLGGEARDAVEDVARLGGVSIAAHPGSAKGDLQWSDWSLPVSGFEWLNGDSEWRDESAWSLARALIGYPARRTETLLSTLDRPAGVLERWDRVTRGRRAMVVAGTDAHARVGLRSLGEPYDRTAAFHVPGYERMFGVFSTVLTDTTLSGDASTDAQRVIEAVRGGRTYTRVDAVANHGTLTLTAESGAAHAATGGVLPADVPVTLRAELHDPPPGVRLELLKNGVAVAGSTSARLEHAADRATGAYRVEVQAPGAPGMPPVPWIVSNPIYLGSYQDAAAMPLRPPPAAATVQYADGAATGWTIETSASALGALDVAPATRGTQLALRYALGGAESQSPYVAFVMPAGGALAAHDRLIFTGRSDRPMRLSVQLREPGGEQGRRWQRSVVLDSEARDVVVPFDELRPADEGTGPPALDRVDSVLFVVDTVHTPLGASGRIWIDEVKYGR
ncbi:MAG: hypothetical protein A3H29_18870 [Acidobacteria bacterium RIFCSPLOWO2_02_FULL_67_21]|nr:MAG: hypothetical protein A3H29_18870 [Acidobacteria bacterium RIFCSPLOWO2_02_FULL_67_21]